MKERKFKKNKKNKKRWMSYTTVGILSGVGALGVAAGIIVPKILEMKDGLDDFIPNKHAWINESSKARTEGLNYVSLGDSISAGFNSFLGEDYLGYSDFLAKDLENANMLNKYSNYAVSGAEIQDLHNMITRSPSVMSSLQNADLITVHIGANDLLACMRIAAEQFGMSLGGILGLPNMPYDENRDNAFPDQNGGASDPMQINQRWSNLENSISQLSTMSETNDFDQLLSLPPQLIAPALNMVKRDIVNVIGDLGKVATHADVMILAPAFPFVNMPKSLIDGNPDPGYFKNFKDAFQQFSDSIKYVSTLSGGFVKYQAIDEISEYKNDNSGYLKRDLQAAAPEIITNPTKAQMDDSDWHWRKMPNIADIHPSVWGYSEIGNGLFHILSSEKNTLNISDPQDFYQAPAKYDASDSTKEAAQKFEMLDEGKGVHNTGDIIGREVLRHDTTHNLLAEIILGSQETSNKNSNSQKSSLGLDQDHLDQYFKAFFGDLNVDIKTDMQDPMKHMDDLLKLFNEPNFTQVLVQITALMADAGANYNPKDAKDQTNTNAGYVISQYLKTAKNSTLANVIKLLPTAIDLIPQIRQAVMQNVSNNNFEDFQKTLTGMGLKNVSSQLKGTFDQFKATDEEITAQTPKISNFVEMVNGLNVDYNASIHRNDSEPINDIWTQINERPRAETEQFLTAKASQLEKLNSTDWNKFASILAPMVNKEADQITASDIATVTQPLAGIEDISFNNLKTNQTKIAKDMANALLLEKSFIHSKTNNDPTNPLLIYFSDFMKLTQ